MKEYQKFIDNILDKACESHEDISSCYNSKEYKLIDDFLTNPEPIEQDIDLKNFLQEDLTKQESYFLYKRDMEREILMNEERIFLLSEEITDLLQANKNSRILIEDMLTNILNNGSKEK